MEHSCQGKTAQNGKDIFLCCKNDVFGFSLVLSLEAQFSIGSVFGNFQDNLLLHNL